jgi:hypothetical protein
VPFSVSLTLGKGPTLLRTQGPPFCGCTQLSLEDLDERPVSELLQLLQQLVDWNMLHTLAISCMR